jgi:hypothetical protein
MVALALATAGITATGAIGYLALGRNRYAGMASRSRKRLVNC